MIAGNAHVDRLIDCDRLIMMKLMLVGIRHFRNLFLMPVFCWGRVVSIDLIIESKGLFLQSRMCMFLNPPGMQLGKSATSSFWT